MDEFLKDIRDGETVATEQPFTVCSARARAELLQSIPAAPSDAVLRLLNAARWKLRQGQDVSFRYISSRSLEGHFGSRARQLEFKVTRARNEYVQATLKGLEAPFGEDHRVVDLVRGVFRGLPHCRMLTIHGSGFREFLILRKDSTEIPADICFQKSENLSLTFFDVEPDAWTRFRQSLEQMAYSRLEQPERILPFESVERQNGSFLAYRTRPFTAIRSYALGPHKRPGFQADLWEGPYDRASGSTLVLQKQRPRGFKFLRWRPNYGNPTFVHHSLSSRLDFGPLEYHATFMVSSSECRPYVHFLSRGMVSDPVPVSGPLGLKGLVRWPGLTYDIWGTALVKNVAFEEAVRWTQTQIDRTSETLKEQLDGVLDSLRHSGLIKKPYLEETLTKLQVYWS